MLKINNRNTRKRYKIYSKLATKIPWTTSLWTYFITFYIASIADFEQVNLAGKLVMNALSSILDFKKQKVDSNAIIE